VIKLLIARNVPMEIENMYGGTVFGQAMWSAVNEYTPDHAAIIEELVRAGAVVDPGYREWWDKQTVPDASTKERVAAVLDEHAKFHDRVEKAQEIVSQAEAKGPSRALADALKELGNILRRPPFTRDAANKVYARAAALYAKLGLPLEEAWVKRHIGINHEYAERLTEAEKFYDQALDLYRAHSVDDLDYANAVRYPAVIKNRLGKRDESAILWEEACERYSNVHPNGIGEGVAEAAAWLTIFAIEKGDLSLARKWFAKASGASGRSGDPDTHKFIAEVRSRLEESENG
jgi:tetratricopeptide (TPR) repeat protein